MAANNFFAYSQATAPAAGYNAGVAPPPPPPAGYGSAAAAAAAAGVAVTPSVAVAAQPPPQVPVAAQPPGQPPPQAATYRPVIALTGYQHQPGVNPATYVMAPPTASASPVVSVTSVYPTSTYHPYPPPPATVPAATGPVQVYDANIKTSYYAQPTTVNAVTVAPVTYTLGEAHYRSTVHSVSSGNPPMSRPAQPQAVTQNVMRVSYTYGQPPTSSYTYANAPAVQQAAQAAPIVKSNMYAMPPNTSSNTSWTASMRGPVTAIRPPVKVPKPPPKPQQLHYCDICKISCAGPQTYKEHLEGQKHKKKAANAPVAKALQPTSNPHSSNVKVGNALRCELCDVTCTGSDAYAAHIRGAKHQKVIKLHTRLGKPIPSVEPIIVSTSSSADPEKAKNGLKASSNPAGPKINIVSMAEAANSKGKINGNQEEVVTIPLLPEEKHIQPVGFDYIEEVRNEENKILSFRCKLCECKFNDPNAKEMHMKGRRHRLQYKKKVNPDLVVDLKPSLRQRRLAEERAKRSMAKEEFWRRREEEFRLMEEEEKNLLWGNVVANNLQQPLPMMMRRPDSSDDRHVIAKHGQIYPTDEQLASIQKQVSLVERGLKSVSDSLESELKLKGVMRVGPLANGLLLKSDSSVQLILLASDVPTTSFLESISSKLQSQLSNKSESECYKVNACPTQARLDVKGASMCVQVGITSPAVRAQEEVKAECLPRDKCLEHLASIRHAKWFGARAAGLQSSVMILRILRDLQSWSDHWKPLEPFALELIVEKSLASAGLPLSPGDALRRAFEAISGGCLLHGSPGLLDPCEKEAKDALQNLTKQQREDLTSDAQKSLRFIAFRQIHKVLKMDPLPINKFQNSNSGGATGKSTSNSTTNRKRPTTEQNGAAGEPSAKMAKEN